MKIKKILNSDYFFALFTKGIVILTGVLSNIFLTRYLGVELKGDYAYVNTVIGLLTVVLNFGIYQTYMHQRKKNGKAILQKYLNIFLYQFIIYTVVFVIAQFFLDSFRLTLALLALPLEILNQQVMMILLVEEYKCRQNTTIIAQVIYLILTVILYYAMPHNLIWPIVIILIKAIFCVTVAYRKLYDFHGSHALDIPFLKENLSGGFLMMIATVMLTLNYKIDVLMLDHYTDSYQIGLYSVGVGLAEYIWIIPDAFKEVLFGKNAKGNANRDVNRSIIINLIILAPIILIVYLFGKDIITLMYGIDFADSYGVTNILCLGVPVMMLFKIIGTVYIAEGKYVFYTVSLSISVAINVIANCLLIPNYGIIGAAWASVASYNVCGLIFFLKYLNDYYITRKGA